MKKLKKIIKYLATIMVGIGPFTADTNIGPTLMVIGIGLMAIEFVENKQWHLVALNIVSAAGWLFTLIQR